MEKITPYKPLHTLKSFGTDIWTVDGGIVRMSYLGGSTPFTTRMVVVRLPSGELWIWSPVELTDGLRAEVAEIGPVQHLVSPNAIHYANIPAWAEAYPAARVWASPGVRERANKQGIEVSFTDDLEDTAPTAWADTIEQHVFKGSRILEEVVFFHRPSRTLVLADLIENFEADRFPRGLRWALRLAGVLHPDGKLPIDLRLSYFGRHRIARRSLAVVLGWKPEKITVAHGRCYKKDAAEELRRAFRWLDPEKIETQSNA